MLKKSLKNRVVVAVAISVMLIACTNQDRLPQYVITGHVDGSDGTVVYLYKYLPEYDMQTRFDSTSVEDGQFQFIGNTDRPVEAYLRLSSDSAIYSFVLTNNRITFLKTDDSYRFDGSESNRHLSELLGYKIKYEASRQALQKQYKRLCDDSTLTKVREDSLAAAYHQARLDFGSAIARKISKFADNYPLAARTSLRLYHEYMSQSDVDSIQSVLFRTQK